MGIQLNLINNNSCAHQENAPGSYRLLHYRRLHRHFSSMIPITQSAGIGGGPILNICLMIGFGYSAKQSMSITYLFLMGGAVASMWKNFKKVHPEMKVLQMNYDLIMITLPMAACGSIFGVFFI